eukprot:TRINITY_DN4139_c0_g3_i1.p1 TRINITY_DN4139_c0_g3~~TRINITY_DN4139_c0_g3_i1.p1  ORF type:complete len:221 (-),score=36.79 TRINITY_DN4139_c0_g3_i1:213-875(-)
MIHLILLVSALVSGVSTQFVSTSYFPTSSCTSSPVASVLYATPTQCQQQPDGSSRYSLCKGSNLFDYSCPSSQCSGTCTGTHVSPACQTFGGQFGMTETCEAAPPAMPNSFTYQEVAGSSTCADAASIVVSVSFALGLCMPSSSGEYFRYDYNSDFDVVLDSVCADSQCTICNCNQQALGCQPDQSGNSYRFFVTSPQTSVKRTCAQPAGPFVPRLAPRL